jgi:hypothetical protein
MPETPEARVLRLALANPVLREILARAPTLGAPDWLLVAGGVTQSVWNVLDGHDPTRGIKDYDLFYFDAADPSYEAEDAVIRRGAALFGERPVEIRNQARVHLWYEAKHGRPYPALRSSADGLTKFLTTCTAVGVGPDGLVAPVGVDDLLAFRVRPLWRGGTAEAYADKTDRWKGLWPRLTVERW